MRIAEKIIVAGSSIFRRLVDYVIFALRNDERAGEICAKSVTRAESGDVRRQARALSSARTIRNGDWGVAVAFALFPTYRSYRCRATARDALGSVERGLLPSAIRLVQCPAASRRIVERWERFFLWTLVGLFRRASGQQHSGCDCVCARPMVR